MGNGCMNPRFLALGTSGSVLSASRPCRFTPGTHWTGGWVGPGAGLNNMEK
jgi:hypothetical protein